MEHFNARYDAIAEQYDEWLRRSTLYPEVLLPSLWELISNVRAQRVLDVGCGQGIVTRELARHGAHVFGVDLSLKLLQLARAYEHRQPRGISYLCDDVQELHSLADSSFDGAVCNMVLMDIADLQAIFASVHRILENGGWFVFSITHPCFETPHARWVTSDDGTIAREVRGYFQERYWRSSDPTGLRGQVGAHHRMLGTYLNTLADAGFHLERILEPEASPNRVEQVPGNREVPTILCVRARSDG